MVAPKSETPEPAAATPPAPAAAAAAAPEKGARPPAPEKEKGGAPAAAPAKSGFSLKAWIPAIIALSAAPAASWAVTQFVMLPAIKKQLAAPLTASAAPAPAPEAAPAAADGKTAAGANPPTYEFDNIVVNLAGTMGTRYLKTTFIVTGVDASLKSVFEENKARLTDVTLNVLSSLTLADLEEPGSKNVLREKLVTTYNQALGRKIADQVYFSDFVVQ